MACVNPDGTLMPSTVAILNALKTAHTAEELAVIVLQHHWFRFTEIKIIITP